MRRRGVTAFVVTVVVGGTMSTAAPPAEAARKTCFGRAATIVGTNRDPLRSEELTGTPRDDVIVGLGGVDLIDGRGGDDIICGGGADDYIKAGPGNDRVAGGDDLDTLFGGGGRDRLQGGEGGGDSLSGGPGDDRLSGGRGSEDSLIGGPGDDFIDGGGGYDRAEFWDSPRGIHADLRSDTATGHGDDTINAIEGLVGSNFDDVLFGDELSNDLQSGPGDDEIYALGSSGDGGSDILRTAGGDNIVDGGDGPDIVSYNVTPWPVSVDLVAGETTYEFGTDTLIGIEHVTGSKDDDAIVGDGGDNVIIGNGGDDVMDGGGGVDEAAFLDSRESVVVDMGAGTAHAGEWGSDTFVNIENIAGSIWADVLIGNDGPNLIWAGDRADTVRGLGGDDILIGARGTDEVDGGADTDACDGETEIDCELEPDDPARSLGEDVIFRSSLWRGL